MSDLILMMWLVDLVSVAPGIAAISLVTAVGFCFWYGIASVEGWEKPNRALAAFPIVLALTAWLMPSKQTLYAAIALKAGSEIVESRLGSKAVTALEGVLDEVIAKQGAKK